MWTLTALVAVSSSLASAAVNIIDLVFVVVSVDACLYSLNHFEKRTYDAACSMLVV